ncbi:hypothetical protein [Intestinibacter bartlettii]|uniref:Uncharacterized protein n=2 Tax=root TaxID=1 RepID=A0A6N3A215_9FIRM
MKLVQYKKIKNNDIYYFRLYKKKIIINNNFQGVLILNLNFELIYEINFSKKILIYRDYIIENKIILDCRELNYFICIDIDNYSYYILDVLNFNHDIELIRKSNEKYKFIIITKTKEIFGFDFEKNKIKLFYKMYLLKNKRKTKAQNNSNNKFYFNIENPKFIIKKRNIIVGYNEENLEVINYENNNRNQFEVYENKSKEEWIFRNVEICILNKKNYLFILENNMSNIYESNLLCYEV